jgi:hypothetical protein
MAMAGLPGMPGVSIGMQDALAAAGNVLHDHLLPVRVFWEHRADGAKQDAGGTACCPGDDDLCGI